MITVPDKKAKQLMDYYYNLFVNNLFDEKDVHSFLILSREYIKDSSFEDKYTKENWIVEACDFIAHRERDRGVIFDTLRAVRQVHPIEHRGKISGAKGIESPDFIVMFNYFLEVVGYAKLKDKTVLDIFLCIYSLMQFSKYVDKSTKQCLGVLNLLLTPHDIRLITSGTHIHSGTDELHVCVTYVKNTYMTTDFFREENPPMFFCFNPLTVHRKKGRIVIEYDGKII